MRKRRYLLGIIHRKKRQAGIVREGSSDGEIPDIETAPVFTTIEEAEQSIRHLPYEILAVFSTDGTFLAGAKGNESSASLPAGQDRLVEDAVCIHNHPTEKTFSHDDIRFIRDLNPADFRVVTKTKRFRRVRPESGWPPNLVDQYLQWYTTFYHRCKKVRAKLGDNEFSRRVFREALRRTVKDLRLDYREEDL